MSEVKPQALIQEPNKSGFRGYSIQDPARIVIFNQLTTCLEDVKLLEQELYSLGYFRLRTALSAEQNLNTLFTLVRQKLEYPGKKIFEQGHRFRRDWHWPVMAHFRESKRMGSSDKVHNDVKHFSLQGIQTWIDFFTMFVEEDGITKFERPATLFQKSAFSELDV